MSEKNAWSFIIYMMSFHLYNHFLHYVAILIAFPFLGIFKKFIFALQIHHGQEIAIQFGLHSSVSRVAENL